MYFSLGANLRRKGQPLYPFFNLCDGSQQIISDKQQFHSVKSQLESAQLGWVKAVFCRLLESNASSRPLLNDYLISQENSYWMLAPLQSPMDDILFGFLVILKLFQ